MLDKLRNFSKGKLAGVLVAIIIIPFVFWGMGSVFSGGNTNSIAKINNYNVSTQDFADFVNNSKISAEVIKENIDNNIIEQLLSQLVSISLIDLEINDLKISISIRVVDTNWANSSSRTLLSIFSFITSVLICELFTKSAKSCVDTL